MAVSKVVPTTVITVGPAVIGVAYTMHKPAAAVVGVPSATYAPGAKSFADKADHYAAIGAWVDSESERVATYCGKIAEVKAGGNRIVVVISQSAVRHDPKGGIYSKVASVEELLIGLSILADETITVA
jgi:hypothetical protein